MNSYRQILYHIVFCTFNRDNTIPIDQQVALYKYVWGIITKRKCVLYRINGMENHIHILSDLHPTVALADFVKEIKTASNTWMKETGRYPKFISWAEGYCALTYAYRDKEMIVNYIKNQKEHHKRITFEDEYRALLKENGVEFDERYIF
ncbi:MAG: IS200/IS605 family transposase [Bacteroidia bacterium]|nr:IS200/IS605 family transposase [Bacteroidia bacterium]